MSNYHGNLSIDGSNQYVPRYHGKLHLDVHRHNGIYHAWEWTLYREDERIGSDDTLHTALVPVRRTRALTYWGAMFFGMRAAKRFRKQRGEFTPPMVRTIDA